LQGRQVEHTRREIKEIEIVLKKEQNKHSLLQTKFKDIASERSKNGKIQVSFSKKCRGFKA